MKNFFVKLLLFFAASKRKKGKSPFPNKFLVVSTTALGDTLWGTPALKALKHTYPHSSLCVLTSELGEQVLRHNPHIDELFVIKHALFFSLLRHFYSLKKRNFDAILIFHSSQRLILPFCALLGCPQIVATAGLNKDLDFILTSALENKAQHEIERRLDIVKEVGAVVQERELEFFFTGEDEKTTERFLERHGISPSTILIGIHPGAQKMFKQWSADNFIQLGNTLKEELGCKIIITGSQEEAFLVLQIASKISEAIPMAGELSLPAFAVLQKRMALFVTGDTGPMHMAFAMKTPTIALFGPTNPDLCGPHHAKNSIVIQKKKTCSPCLMKKCEDPFCLLQIGVKEVCEKALKLVHSAQI